MHEPAIITCLQLYLQDADDCERAGVLINLAPNVKSLAIEFDRRIRMENGINRSPWEFTRRLFASVQVDTPRVGLESLRITSFPLTDLKDLLPTIFAMQDLKHLQLVNCQWVGSFIQMLSQFSVSLASYVLISDYDHSGIRGPNETLLSSMTAPRRLRMSSRDGDMLCGWPVLTAPAASLQSLYIADDRIDDTGPPVVHRGLTGFKAFCEAASGLEQLAITCPTIEEKLWDVADGFVSFLVSSHTRYRQVALHSLTIYQDCLTPITALKVLHLTIYPSCGQFEEGESVSNELRMLALRHVLKLAVDQIFQTFAATSPGFMAVIFNVRGDWSPGDFGTPYEPPAFIRSKQCDPTGDVSYVGTPIKAHLIKRYEPCFDLLDPPTLIYN